MRIPAYTLSFTRVRPTIERMLLAERLVGEARTRHRQGLNPREWTVLAGSAGAFLAAAVAILLLVPNERETNVLLLVGLVLGYVAVDRVRFEFGNYFGTAGQLLIVPITLLVPLPLVPLSIAAALTAGIVPDIVRGNWHRQRLMDQLADCWFCIPSVLILAALAPGAPQVEHVEVYALAFAGQLAGDFVWSWVRNELLDQVPTRELVASWLGSVAVDSVFAPIALIITLAADVHPLTLLVIGPLAWLLNKFAQDREERYAKTLELNRAYRGTVMLLSDVVEFEDDYTAEHSRSVVDLTHSVAAEMGISEDERQELEFAAMLHDVGKISIPKDILNKPSRLTDEEYELMKQHTIEGQFMLDRIGGLLGRVGEIVRSCHERWDGKGYPDGLKGEQIPLRARIVFCCDAYHAMTSDRPYRAAMPTEDALAELTANAGTQFDPAVVAALVKVVQQGEPVRAVVDDEVRAVLASTATRQELSAGIPSS